MRGRAHHTGHLRLALLTGTMLAMSGLAPAGAQTRTTAPMAARAIAVPAGPLTPALNRLAVQTGLQILFDARLATGKATRGAQGNLTPAQALSAVLAGTGLSARSAGVNAVTIVGTAGAAAGATPDGAIALDTIDVSGGRGPSAADEPFQTPGSSAHISREQIQRVPPTSLGDMFRETPGVISAGGRTGSGLNLNIRGLQGMNRVATLVDGTQQSGSQYIGYRGQTSSVYIDPDLIAGIDIIKGPSDGPYGSGAMGGVVNMRTLEARDIVRPGQTYGARLIAGLGTNTVAPAIGSTSVRTDRDGFFNGASFNGSLAAAVMTDRYEFLTAVSRRRSGNYFAGTTGATTFTSYPPFSGPTQVPLSPIRPGQEVFNTSEDSLSILTKAKLIFGEGQSLEFGFTHYENRRGEINDIDLVYSNWFVARQYNLSKTATNTFTLRYAYDPGDNPYLNLRANLWFTDYKSDRYSAGTVLNDLSGILPIQTLGSEVWNRSQFRTPFGRLDLDYGVQLTREAAYGLDFGMRNYPGVGWLYNGADPGGTRFTGGPFSRASLKPTDWLTLAGGLRYDYYSLDGKDRPLSQIETAHQSAGRLNPTASITIEPWQGLQVFGQYSQGWRPPSLRETTFLLGGPGAILGPNPNLKPEEARNVEFGANVSRNGILTDNDRLRLKIAYFNNNYDNYIVRLRDPQFRFSYIWGNIEKAKFEGYEISGSYDAGLIFVQAAFNLYTNIKYCAAGQPCTGLGIGTDYGANYIPPRYSGSVTLGARLFDEALVLGTRVTFAGERAGSAPGAFIPATVWPASTVVDLFGSYKISENLKLNVSASNIFDRYYLEPLTISSVPSPGRTVKAGIEARF